LHVTIALISWGEKPQLSPRPAVVFSKKAGAIYNSHEAARVARAPRNPTAILFGNSVGLVFKGFVACRPRLSRRRDAAKALFCRSREV
jgi:hypothetical protein